VAHLGLLGFVEGIAYDHAGYTLVRGSLPAENLYRLLKDLRTQPSGWFAAAVSPAALPLPLRAVLPVRLVEVLPDTAAAGLAALPEVQAIRLPRAGSETVRPGATGGVDPAAWLRSSNVADLHRAGYRGAGVRVVVIASGFPGVTSLVGNRLPASTRVIDL